MATTYPNPEKDTDAEPNAEARTERTCVFCGETDAQVKRNTFQTEDWPAVDAHDMCAPPMHEFYAWARRRFEQ